MKIARYGIICLTIFMSIWVIASTVGNFTFYNHDVFEQSVVNPLHFWVAFCAILGWIISLWSQKFMRHGKMIITNRAIFAMVASIAIIASLGFFQYWFGHGDVVDFNLRHLSAVILPSFMGGYFLGIATFFYEYFQKYP